MAHLTIFILVILAVGISETFTRSVFIPDVSIDDIKEMYDRGRDGHKSFTCPSTSGRYPDPENCENYYECQRGYATLKHCHRGKLFDRKRHECRDKGDVKCDAKRRTDSDEDSSGDKSNESREAKLSFKCPSYSGRYPDPKSCENYYECKQKRPTLKHCQREQFYDSVRRECRDQRYVKCHIEKDEDSNEDKSEDKSNESKESHQSFKCPTSSGRYPDPKNCENYYECKKGQSTLKHCHRGKLYDSKQRECRDKRDVKCDIGREKDLDEDKSEEITEKNFKCPHTWGSFAHPNDCSKYFVCLSKRPKLYQCNRYFLYDEKIGKCLPREKVNCGKRLDREDLPSSTTKIPYTTRTTTFSTLTPTTMKEVPSTISTSESEAITTSPSEGTTLAPTTLAPTTTTLAPNTVTTLAPTTTTTTLAPNTVTTLAPNTVTTLAPNTITTLALNTVTTLAPTTTTTAAPTTLAGTTTTTAVPTFITKTFSPTTTTQEPTSSSVANDITETEFPATKPNTPPPTDCDKDDLDCIIDGTGDVKGWFDCPKQYGHFPHGGSDQLFIHCDNWKPYVKKCAENTHFSPEYLVCVW